MDQDFVREAERNIFCFLGFIISSILRIEKSFVLGIIM